jgi:hypothetical protein
MQSCHSSTQRCATSRAIHAESYIHTYIHTYTEETSANVQPRNGYNLVWLLGRKELREESAYPFYQDERPKVIYMGRRVRARFTCKMQDPNLLAT